MRGINAGRKGRARERAREMTHDERDICSHSTHSAYLFFSLASNCWDIAAENYNACVSVFVY